MVAPKRDDLVFQHLIDLPHCDCVFCSTREQSTGITRLFLVFNDEQRIYMRNSVKETWDELDDERYRSVRRGFDMALQESRVPCFSA